MPDLRKSLGELYGSSPSPTPASRSGRGEDGPTLDPDLAEALSAALVNAPGAPGAAQAPAAPAADVAAPTAPRPAGPTAGGAAARSRMAGTLREFHRDALKPAQAPPGPTAAPGAAPGQGGTASPAPAAARPTGPVIEPLPGVMWRREDDDILPAGGPAPAVRGLHLNRRRK